MSHDIEDIITVIDHRSILGVELNCRENPLVKPARQVIEILCQHPDIQFIVAGHLPPDAGNQARVHNLVDKMNSLLNYGSE